MPACLASNAATNNLRSLNVESFLILFARSDMTHMLSGVYPFELSIRSSDGE